jgi:hypothetical protein
MVCLLIIQRKPDGTYDIDSVIYTYKWDLTTGSQLGTKPDWMNFASIKIYRTDN